MITKITAAKQFKDNKVLVSIDRKSILFQLIVVLVLAGLATNFYMEWQLGGFTKYSIKHLSVFSIISISAVLWRLKKVSTSFLLILITYINIVSSTIYLPYRIDDTQLNFEGYFLRVEIMVFVMALVLAVFAKQIHQLVVIGYNSIYITLCAVFGPTMPLTKYVLAFILVSSVAGVSYVIFKEIITLRNNLQERNRKITEQNSELQELTNFRKEIVQIIGHDLRAPIKQLSVLTELALKSKTPEEQKQCLELIAMSSDKTYGMLEGLLEWAMQNNEVIKNYMQLNVHEVLEDIKTNYTESLRQKSIEIANEIQKDQTIFFSKQVLETVIRNLLTNAIKFSPNNEKITAQLSEDDKHYYVNILNKASNVDSSKLDAINSGETVESSDGTNNEKGSGKGLSICQKMLNKNNAKLELAPNDDGVEARIIIEKTKAKSYKIGQGMQSA